MDYTLETLKIIFYLGLVLGLIYLTAAFFRKRITGQGESRYINVLERNFPAAKTSLALVEVRGRVYLLGIGEAGVSVLDKWEREEFGEIPLKPDRTSSERAEAFREQLQRFIRGSRDEHDE